MARPAISIAMTLRDTERASAHQSPVTAIDIALEPDQTMIGHAKAANATLLKNFPKGFSLDETHHPHVSIFAGFVPTADLPKVYAAAGEVLGKEKYTTWKLTAFKYYYIPLGPIGLAGIVIEPTPDLLRLQQELIDAAGPHTVKTATAATFYTTPAEPDIHPSVIDYIAGFSDHVGKNFSPHVTIGLGLKAFLDAMLAAPSVAFTFSPASASVYQFDDFGTARNRLRSFPQTSESIPSEIYMREFNSPWNDGAAKQAITDFVARVTTQGGPDFVPPVERIAVFDNDGTLWAEQPMYFQLAFILDRLKTLAPQHPEWKDQQPFKAVLEGDLAAFGPHELLGLAAATHSGMTTDEFTKIVTDWLAAARHPKFNRPYTEVVFRPMIDLMGYLRANDFKTFIVSGGGVEFMRPWVERVYGIPPEQVVGSSGVTNFQVGSDGKPVLKKEPNIEFVNDGPGKPAGINRFIGRRPILAFGNSDADLQMLQWTAAGAGARFIGLVHHTDVEREYAYDRQSHFGKLDKVLDVAPLNKWTVVDMKKDWTVIFPFEKH